MAADLQWHGDGDATGAGTGEKVGAGVLGVFLDSGVVGVGLPGGFVRTCARPGRGPRCGPEFAPKTKFFKPQSSS